MFLSQFANIPQNQFFVGYGTAALYVLLIMLAVELLPPTSS
jgi:hypothetical protein